MPIERPEGRDARELDFYRDLNLNPPPQPGGFFYDGAGSGLRRRPNRFTGRRVKWIKSIQSPSLSERRAYAVL